MVVKFENFLKNLTYLYKISLLEWITKRKTITIFLLGTLALTIFFFNFAKKELIAPEDRGAFFVIVKAPQAQGLSLPPQKLRILKNCYYQKWGKVSIED